MSVTAPKVMRAIIKPDAAPGFALREVPVPRPGPREVLIRVERAAICGTDVHIYDWDAWAAGRVRPGTIIGHEFMGRVTTVGDEVHGVEPGARVSGEGHIGCGQCYFCRTGQMHICDRMQIIGIDVHGCFADYICLPEENVWQLHPAIPDRLAAIHDPLGNAMQTVMVQSVAGSIVLVVGVGPIGLMTVNIAKAAGAIRVIALDVNEKRLALARVMGADHTFNVNESGFEDRVRALTRGGYGADVFLEASGNPAGIHTGLELLRRGGWAALLGIPSRAVQLDLAEDVIFKSVTIHGITGRKMYETWYQVESFLTHGRLQIEPVITHQVPLEVIDEGIQLMKRGEAVKVLVQVGETT